VLLVLFNDGEYRTLRRIRYLDYCDSILYDVVE
jgi:hypothetical protein